ncbi:hypothetical protein [Amycolatopsis marina]|nr:hypothetical protein [Amycolatopsis marina]
MPATLGWRGYGHLAAGPVAFGNGWAMSGGGGAVVSVVAARYRHVR